MQSYQLDREMLQHNHNLGVQHGEPVILPPVIAPEQIQINQQAEVMYEQNASRAEI